MNHEVNANNELWDSWAAAHAQSDFYDVAGFRSGVSSLRHIELAELTDVAGKSLLHLQCHFGMDTLSWARLGAKVTGVDFSEKAIQLARELASELTLDARFVRADLTVVDGLVAQPFDIVFTSYGAICWLSDLDHWAALIHRNLKPGGTFYMAEFHPVVYSLDDDGLQTYPYFASKTPIAEDESSYADGDNQATRKRSYTWPHHLGEVVTALINAGLNLEFLHDFPYSPYDCFPNMRQEEPQKFVFEDKVTTPPGGLPLTFSLKANKPQ